jgi:ribosomal protein S18 acetylase RimI-like enzyme
MTRVRGSGTTWLLPFRVAGHPQHGYHELYMNPKIVLRPASVEDEPFLFVLFRAVRADRFDFQPGGHPQMAVMVRLQFKAQEHTLASQYPGSKHSIILLDGVAVGRLRVVRDETGFQLADISILPERQRRGIGKAVMKDLMAEAQRAGLPVRSTVARANQASVHFYRNLGFEVTDQDAAYVRMQWRSAI